LTFVALACPTPLQHQRRERRVLTRASRRS
jgi:hypothetical protein